MDDPAKPKKLKEDDKPTSGISQDATTEKMEKKRKDDKTNKGDEKNDCDLPDGSQAEFDSEKRKRNISAASIEHESAPTTYSAIAKKNVPQEPHTLQSRKVRNTKQFTA